jgi:hypothetical protein
VRSLANLSYRDVLVGADAPDEDRTEPALELKIELSEGESRTYRIAKLTDSEDYVLRSADRPQAFKLSKYDLMELIDLERSKLIVQPEPASESATAEEAPNPASATDTDAN